MFVGADIGEFSIFIHPKTLFEEKDNNSSTNDYYKGQKVMIISVIDNSGSMGKHTQECATVFSNLYDISKTCVMVPGALIVFSEQAHVLSTNITSSNDLKQITFPGQGMTNIVSGIVSAIEFVTTHKKTYPNENIHYIINFLSDGGHNSGPPFTDNQLKTMRRELILLDIKLTLIVVGIINSDTTLGMKIKTNLETVNIPYINSVYYAQSLVEMDYVLNHVLDGCSKSLRNSKTIKLKALNGIFIENMSSELCGFVSNEDDIYFIVKAQDPDKPVRLIVDGVEPKIIKREPTMHDMSCVVDALCPKLSQKNIASGTDSIRVQIELVDKFIDLIEDFKKSNLPSKGELKGSLAEDDIGKVKINAFDRLAMVKKLTKQRNEFQNERNKLKNLLVTISNDSAKQAEYLNGVNSKYAAKAINRAETIKMSLDDILLEMKKIIPLMMDALAKDKKMINYSSDMNIDSSLLSFKNVIEHYEEWALLAERSANDFDNLYALLVFCGFVGYPVKFHQNNAVQMDPFQTECTKIEPFLIDTPTMMMGNQLGHKLRSPNNNTLSDTLILISPSCPRASTIALRSYLYQFTCSVTLCRDLYMYNWNMTFSMHAHSLLKTISEYYQTKSTAYLNLAVQIVYSIRKYWGNNIYNQEENNKLFHRWFEKWSTITPSDGCCHPVQLLLMLSAYDVSELGIKITDEIFHVPLINLLNEALSRIIKIKLAALGNNSNSPFYQMPIPKIAIKLMQKLLNITADISPVPDPDPMKSEPPVEVIRQSCQQIPFDKLNMEVLQKELHVNTDLIQWVENLLTPYLRTYHFAKNIQQYLFTSKTNWNQLCEEIESTQQMPKYLIEYMISHQQSKSVYEYIEIKESNIQLVAVNMVMQAMLTCHDSAARSKIDLKDVREYETYCEMCIDLMMNFYTKANQVKRKNYLATVGVVSYGTALGASIQEYDRMLGKHTHGLDGLQFWSLYRVGQTDPAKFQLFMEKSNACFKRRFY